MSIAAIESAPTFRKGTIDVAVLKPIPTKRWKAAEIGERTEEVRERFRATLERWPEE